MTPTPSVASRPRDFIAAVSLEYLDNSFCIADSPDAWSKRFYKCVKTITQRPWIDITLTNKKDGGVSKLERNKISRNPPKPFSDIEKYHVLELTGATKSRVIGSYSSSDGVYYVFWIDVTGIVYNH